MSCKYFSQFVISFLSLFMVFIVIAVCLNLGHFETMMSWLDKLWIFCIVFRLNQVHKYVRLSVEQYKKGKTRFSPLGIKGWVKHNTFILDLNNCYYPHCAWAVISGSQRKKEKKHNRTVMVNLCNVVWNLIISRPYLGLGILETKHHHRRTLLSYWFGNCGIGRISGLYFLLFWVSFFNIFCIQTHNFYDKGISFKVD